MASVISLSRFCGVVIVLVLTLTFGEAYTQDSLQVTKKDTQVVNYSMLGNRYKYFSEKHFEQKTLFKASAFSSSLIQGGYVGFPEASAAIERKLSPIFSIEGGWIPPEGNKHFGFINFRYYYSKRKQGEKEEEKINNFTGSYISLGFTRSFSWNVGGSFWRGFSPDNYINYNIYSLNIGRQTKSR